MIRDIAKLAVYAVGTICLVGIGFTTGGLDNDTLNMHQATLYGLINLIGFGMAVHIGKLFEKGDRKRRMQQMTVMDCFIYLSNGYEVTLENGQVSEVKKSQ